MSTGLVEFYGLSGLVIPISKPKLLIALFLGSNELICPFETCVQKHLGSTRSIFLEVQIKLSLSML